MNGVAFCSRNIFGDPSYDDCTVGLSALPQDDRFRFFAEQQLRTALPLANWDAVIDPRPFLARQEVMQIPKWWNHSKRDRSSNSMFEN